ncbi:diacylglycerol/lipid kinase family protein [Marinicella meishanensis]|uniref:diacylglycerol/lipid kinase family protein n=1 Tax=Marinicella meishanensis TaxID=2873263 RepID=UPI001CBC96FD
MNAPLLIIFNPQAGSGRAQQFLPLIESHLAAHGVAVKIIHTDHAGHAQELVTQADLTPFSGIIAAGGDGTLFEVVNGMMAHPGHERPPLGVIPVGTGNAFSRELGLQPTDWQPGIDLIRQQRTQAIDVGHAHMADQQYHFLNIIGMGFVVDAGRNTLKIKKLGQSAYTLATLWETAKLKKHRVKLTLLDAHNQTLELDDDVVFVEVANSRYTGTSFLIAPAAQIDDGLLDVIILKKISRFKILRLFPTIYSGKHVNYREVETHQVKRITIHTEQPMPLMPDGEFIGHTPVSIDCLPGALRLFC